MLFMMMMLMKITMMGHHGPLMAVVMMTMAMENTEMEITRSGVPRSVSVVYDDGVDEDD